MGLVLAVLLLLLLFINETTQTATGSTTRNEGTNKKRLSKQCDQTRKYKVAQNFPKLPKKSPQQFAHENGIIQSSPNVNTHLGYFCKKICHLEVSKIVQSGHTVSPN